MFVEPLRHQVRHNAILLARQAELEIQSLVRRELRKEESIAEILEVHGRHLGLVDVFLGDGILQMLQAVVRQAVVAHEM